jgi:pilus assembly protein CpaF
MAMMSDVDLPAAHIRTQVCSAIDVIVHLARLRDGRRVVWEIAVVEGTHRGEPVVTSLFRFDPRVGSDGGAEATGAVPAVRATLTRRGETVGPELFEAGADR